MKKQKAYIEYVLSVLSTENNNTKIARDTINKFNLDHITVEQLRKRISRLRLNNEPSTKVVNKVVSKTSSNDYKEPQQFVLSAWNQSDGTMMNIEAYCLHYGLPREDITSYKLVSHTGTPYFNIVFKENLFNEKEIDFDSIIEKYIVPLKYDVQNIANTNDFDKLVYADVHIGMDTNKSKNSMYPILWNRDEAISSAIKMVNKTISMKKSPILYVDELGDFFDGYNAKTTRGGHDLPQNMTNEEAFDCGLEFKLLILDNLVGHYESIVFNNICNDNHAGSFGYFVNKAFQEIAMMRYKNVKVNNYRQFISHYFVGNIAFVITHGKDDVALKFGFKPHLDAGGMEKIDQYCKNNNVYKFADLVVFEKGDSHQTLFDMCTSDDFFYFNYPALSPSSQWVSSNFKRGRRGFVNESYSGLDVSVNPKFL